MNLYVVHDEDCDYVYTVRANTHSEALEKFREWCKKTTQSEEFFYSQRWKVDLCDNETIIE